MLVSGMHIGWGISCPQLRYQEWHLNTYPHEYTMVILSWYLGAILGSLLTLYIYTRFTKREIYVSDLKILSLALFKFKRALSLSFPVLCKWSLCRLLIHRPFRERCSSDNLQSPCWNRSWIRVHHRNLSRLRELQEDVPWNVTHILPLHHHNLSLHGGPYYAHHKRSRCRVV